MTTFILAFKLFNFKPPERNCLYYFGTVLAVLKQYMQLRSGAQITPPAGLIATRICNRRRGGVICGAAPPVFRAWPHHCWVAYLGHFGVGDAESLSGDAALRSMPDV